MRIISLGFLLVLFGAGCSTHDDGSKTQGIAGVGEACHVDGDCLAGLECDDGVCKNDEDEVEDEDAGVACTVDADCAAGEECEDGRCEPDEAECDEHNPCVPCTTDADCAAGEECDDGVCELHGGSGPH